MNLSVDTAMALGPTGPMQGWEWLALESERRTGKRLGHGQDGAREWVEAFMSDGLPLFGLHMDLSVAFLMNLAEADPQAQQTLEAIVSQIAAQSGDAYLYAPDASLAASSMLSTAARGCSDRAATHLLALLQMANIEYDRPFTDGVHPLHAACSAVRPDLALSLLASGSDPNVRDAEGNTPLHRLAETRWRMGMDNDPLVILNGLLRAGASLCASSAKSETAAGKLLKSGFPAAYLLPAADTSASRSRGPGSRRMQ